MSKRYLVVVPVNKEAYCKDFNSLDRAVQLITEKVGTSMPERHTVSNFEREMFMFSLRAKKKNLAVNERATYLAELPSAEDDIFGTAVIIGKQDECIVGLTEETANAVCEEINELRAG